jgi:N-(2-amino-2-carboxyethyl)-L-glutamate synthase
MPECRFSFVPEVRIFIMTTNLQALNLHLGSSARLSVIHRKLNIQTDLLEPLPRFAAETGAAEVIAFMGKRLPAASTKYIAAVGMIEYLAMHDQLEDCNGFVLSTSANTGIAISMIGSEMGISVTVVLDTRTAPGKLDQLRRLGAQIVMLSEPHPSGGFVLARIEKARQIAAATKGVVDVDQYNNLGAPLAHYSFTGRYLWDRLKGRIDIVSAAISTGATAAGIFHRIREYDSRVSTLAVDCEGSILTGGVAGTHLLTGIGAQIVSANMRIAYPAMVGLPPAVISDAEAFSECHRLLHSDGMSVGGSSGAVLAAVRRLGKSVHGKRVVVILADGGESYQDTIFNPVWLKGQNIEIK